MYLSPFLPPDGKDLPFTRENLALLLDADIGAATAVVNAFLEAHQLKGRQKN